MKSVRVTSRFRARSIFGIPVVVAAALVTQGCETNNGSLEEGIIKDGAGCLFKKCVPMVYPPKMTEVGNMRQLAIVSSGSQSRPDPLVAYLSSELSKVRVNDALYYQMVSATDPKRHGVFDVQSTVKTNPLVTTREERSECRDENRGLFKKCKNLVKVNVTCQTRTVSVSGSIRVRNASGVELTNRQEAQQQESKVCTGDTDTLATEDQLSGKALKIVADKLRESLTVQVKMTPVRVKDSTDGFTDQGRAKRFTAEMAFFKEGRLDRSCPAIEEMAEVETRSVSVFYNAGFCAQVRGDWRRAHQLYRQADGLITAPDRDISNALEETRLALVGTKLVN